MEESTFRIFADFNNRDPQGRVRFTDGTFDDVARLKIELKPGLKVIVDDHDEFEIEGVVEFSEEENVWVARFDWDKLRSSKP